MAVPVQTWGALGNMVAEQREFGTKTAEYLEQNEVYDLCHHLLRQVIVHQPANPIKFLQEQLQNRPVLTVSVIGPPGISRSKYCELIASEFKVRHIHVGKLLKARRDCKEDVDSGRLVQDEIVIEVVKAELAKAKTTGWVLDGFPRTKVQASALSHKECGFSLDKVLLLSTGDNVIKERYAQKMAATGSSGKEELINTRLQQYHRHIITIYELFKNVIRQINVGSASDVASDLHATYEIIKSNLHVRPYSNAPMRPPRICVVGACGSGRTAQCEVMAKHYGIVHVDLPPLIRRNQKEKGQKIEDVPPEYLSDEELCDIVGRRLNEIDCQRKGWVLDGFPRTRSQAEFLRQSHLWPCRIIHLIVEEEEVVSRVTHRRIDPITCMAYYKSPNSVAVRQRLVQAPHDEADIVRQRYALHSENVEKGLQCFANISHRIQVGENDINAVSRLVIEKVDDPLPTELAQDSQGGIE